MARSPKKALERAVEHTSHASVEVVHGHDPGDELQLRHPLAQRSVRSRVPPTTENVLSRRSRSARARQIGPACGVRPERTSLSRDGCVRAHDSADAAREDRGSRRTTCLRDATASARSARTAGRPCPAATACEAPSSRARRTNSTSSAGSARSAFTASAICLHSVDREAGRLAGLRPDRKRAACRRDSRA